MQSQPRTGPAVWLKGALPQKSFYARAEFRSLDFRPFAQFILSHFYKLRTGEAEGLRETSKMGPWPQTQTAIDAFEVKLLQKEWD